MSGLANQGNRNHKLEKSVPAFEEVGTPPVVETTETPEVKTEDKPVVKAATSVDEIIATVTDKQKPIEKEPITIFIDSDIKKKFVAFGKKHGKGSRSELINTFLRSIFDKE